MSQQWEALERRIVFGTYSLTLNNTVSNQLGIEQLNISEPTKTFWLLNGEYIGDVGGTAGNDRISVSMDGSHVLVTLNGVTRPNFANVLRIDARRGDDLIDLSGIQDVGGLSITIYGGAGDDTITGSLFGDRIMAGDGNDVVNGGNGRDTVYGEGGDDSVRGNAHGDLLDGGDGADTLRGDDGADNIGGGANSDRLRGSAGDDTLKGGGSRDFLAGEIGDDALYGESGDDFCSGGEGVDYLAGGTGLDGFNGGAGDDNFNDRGPGEDLDFDPAHDRDLIHLAGSDGTLAMYTWGGDANLDGNLDGDDYFFIDTNTNTDTYGWHNGDFNYDGRINGADYLVIDSNLGSP